MLNKIRHSIRNQVHKAGVAIRSLIKIRRINNLTDFATHAGLPVERLENLPLHYPGFLDQDAEPRFIALNCDLPPHEQAWFIAQQVAFCVQRRGCDSLALNRPWKWKLLIDAPEEFRNKILALDQEYRAYWFMLLFANRIEYRLFVKANRKKIFKISFTDNIVRYHLYILWIKMWLTRVCRKFLIIAHPAS